VTVSRGYAKSGGVSIAYEVRTGSPVDVLYMADWVIPIAAMNERHLGYFLDRLNAFSRLILWDRRGVGESDPWPGAPTLEQWVDDALAVMDAVGSDMAVIIGGDIGGQVAQLFAATHPDRTAALVLANTCARYRSSDDYPPGVPDDVVEFVLALVEEMWGRGYPPVEMLAPSLVDDPSFQEWSDTVQRLGASPATAKAMLQMSCDVDLRHVLGSIRVPTLVLHSEGDQIMSVEHGRYLASNIAGARYVELPGANHPVPLADVDLLLDEVEEFVTGMRNSPRPDRGLLTVLFTDIVGSTAVATRLGDRRWRQLLDDHDRVVREHLLRFRGREVKMTGDGFLATFDGPGRAVRCAAAITDAIKSLGIEVRAGLHAGDCELRGDDVSGITVHIASRVCGLAPPSETLVTSAVADLVAASGVAFDEFATRELRGVDGQWRLLRVAAT
jgi:class 3 adenylate cyclase